MNLDEAQRKTVARWIEEGVKLADIQKKLDSEMGIRMTYMEVRLLLDDLRLMPKAELPPEPAKQPEPSPSAAQPPSGPDALEPIPDAAQSAPGEVSVTIDAVTRPGTMISGKVTFSDGKSAEWHLDQFGRLGLVPGDVGYRPPAEDLEAFQIELQMQLQRMGM